MEKSEFEEIMKKYLERIDINLDEEQISKFYNYMNLLLEWNEKINLTAITEFSEVILKHFIDSLTINKHVKENSNLIDVGTGAGFPGIPIKILRGDINVTLLDSLNKRINFLNEVIGELNLEKIISIHSRVEEFGKDNKYREKFDIVTSRAVANLSTLSEYMLPLTKVGGICICMKGSEIKEEIQNSKKAIEILGGKISQIEEFNLPNSDIKRTIVVITKVKNTPVKYPRKPGTPAKEPIK